MLLRRVVAFMFCFRCLKLWTWNLWFVQLFYKVWFCNNGLNWFVITTELVFVKHVVVISLDSPSCRVCMFDPRTGGCVGTLPDRPRIVPFEVCLCWCCLYGDGQRTWAGIIQVVLPQLWHHINQMNGYHHTSILNMWNANHRYSQFRVQYSQFNQIEANH